MSSLDEAQTNKAPPTHTVNVMLTVDTEFWPAQWELNGRNVEAAYQRDILGAVPGETSLYGLPMLLSILEEHQLQAVFFVESLCSLALGDELLTDLIDQIEEASQEVQLHLHPEWYSKRSQPNKGDPHKQFMHQFSEREQEELVGLGLAALARCGAASVNACRAGNYGANNATLRALAGHGVAYDSSYNIPYLDHDCQIKSQAPLYQPDRLDGLIECPVTCFEDWPGHKRHAQLCATSFEELSSLLIQAWEQKWPNFVIVLHSFELLTSTRDRPDRVVIERMEALCQFLRKHEDLLPTRGFGSLSPDELSLDDRSLFLHPLQSKLAYTIRRFQEQAMRRMRSIGHSWLS